MKRRFEWVLVLQLVIFPGCGRGRDVVEEKVPENAAHARRGLEHGPTDTADKLDYRNIREIARLAFAIAWEIASGETTIRSIISE